jgi:uncharacterized protein
VDSAAVQDGFALYLHGFFASDDGDWTVVQQGMNGEKRQARRYHWHSASLVSFVEEPHSAIDGPGQGTIVNLTDRRAAPSRQAQLELLSTLGPDRIADELAVLSAEPVLQPELPHLIMPARHAVRSSDVFIRRLHGTLAAAADRGPADFAELLLTPGVGGRTVEALAMVAEVLHGAPYRFEDPARFSLAHGGKDRHPYPVPIKVYDGDDPRAQIGGWAGQSRPCRGDGGPQAAGSAGAPAGAHGNRSLVRSICCWRASAIAVV